jgi:hypothetical protein
MLNDGYPVSTKKKNNERMRVSNLTEIFTQPRFFAQKILPMCEK